MFTLNQYETLASFGFSADNPGYKPTVVESPDGDGVWDTEKKYAHIAPKYMKLVNPEVDTSAIQALYDQALVEGKRICEALELPVQYHPGPDSTLRVLAYPPGATTAPHYDFDLFTISLFRDETRAFRYLEGEEDPLLVKARGISPGIHFGEILTEAVGAKATRHEVLGTPWRQKSAVFFVIPPHETVLPSGITVGAWIAERIARSRKEA
jgi:hypothetical protein